MAEKDTLLLVGAGALLLWLATRKQQPGGGNGGAVILGGRITQVGTEQVASMGSHLIQKSPGEQITVGVSFTGATKRANGDVIPWPYRVVAQLGHNTIFGWQTAYQLGFNVPGRLVGATMVTGGALNISAFYFTAPNDTNQAWDVKAELFAKKVAPDGITPVAGETDSDWQSLGTGEHVGAVRTGAPNVVAGSVDAVEVYQAFRRGTNLMLPMRQ